jgi:hypothetical protein
VDGERLDAVRLGDLSATDASESASLNERVEVGEVPWTATAAPSEAR